MRRFGRCCTFLHTFTARSHTAEGREGRVHCGPMTACRRTGLSRATTALLCLVACRTEAGFEVNGVATRRESNGRVSMRYEFWVAVQDGRWRIDAVPLDESGPRADAPSIHVAASRQGLYQVERYGPRYSNALILPLPIPNHDPLLGSIWLAYCSSGYLSGQPGHPIAVPVTDSVVSGFPAMLWAGPGLEYRQLSWWQTSPDEPKLPVRFVSKHDGTIRIPHALGVIETGQVFPRPYDKGYTNIVYEVEESTEGGGYRLPKRSKLEVYRLRPLPGGGGGPGALMAVGPPEVAYTVEIVAKTVAEFNEEIVVPPPRAGGGAVSDWRFAWSNHPVCVIYFSTNRWPDVAEVMAMPVYERTIRTWSNRLEIARQAYAGIVGPFQESSPDFRRGLMFLVVACLTLGVLLYKLGKRSEERKGGQP